MYRMRLVNRLGLLVAPLVVISYGLPRSTSLSAQADFGGQSIEKLLSKAVGGGRTELRDCGAAKVFSDGKGLSPVVLVPGTGGNQLEARLTKGYKPGSFWCYSFSSGWFRLWLDALSLIPPFTSCFAERMKLVYNEETKKFENFPGVETRVPHWGTTEGMEYLDPTFKSLASYMGPLVQGLKGEGYEVGKNLFGAPYDFRYAPGPYAADVAIKYTKDLMELIEKAHDDNNQPVILVAHSLGGLWTLYFLNKQPPAWKKKYIKSFVAVAAPWGGSVQEMLTFASGNTEGISFLDPLTLRDEQRSSESNLWLLPVSTVYGSQPLVITPTRTYTAHDMEDFLRDIGYPEGVDAFRTRIPPLTTNMTAPGVPVSIVCGFGVKTPERLLYYEAEGFDRQPTIMNGDGDGTVGYKSLVAVVDDWKKVDGQKIRVVPLAGKSHSTILTEKESVAAIIQEIFHDWTTTGADGELDTPPKENIFRPHLLISADQYPVTGCSTLPDKYEYPQTFGMRKFLRGNNSSVNVLTHKVRSFPE
ncbi:hypothetical protein R1flu_025547 [Riccia fluitans]|uniref:Uncharacterized protein n=1 Tax=Riccia fluitans TaxID=41844 RepID=A0ABD1XYF3_9MARC